MVVVGIIDDHDAIFRPNSHQSLHILFNLMWSDSVTSMESLATEEVQCTLTKTGSVKVATSAWALSTVRCEQKRPLPNWSGLET